MISISFFFIICILLCSFTAVASSNWYQFQMDEKNTGVTGDQAPISDPDDGDSMSWEVELASGIDCTPIVVGDLVYVATANNSVIAFDKETGAVEWRSSSSGSGFLLSNLAYGNHIIFVPTKDGKIFAFDADDGSQLWNKSITSDQLNTPVNYYDHQIFFGDCSNSGASQSTTGGTYYCYNDDGSVAWTHESTGNSGYYWAGAAVKGDYVIFGDDGSNITVLDRDTGAISDEIDTNDVFGVDVKEIRSSIMYYDGRIYFTSKGGYCFALGFNSNTGKLDESDKAFHNIGYSVSTPAIYNERIYVGSAGKLYCLEASDLSLIWEYAVNGDVKSSPAVSSHYDAGNGDAYIYLTTNVEDGKVYCVKDQTGATDPELQWSYSKSGETDFILAGVSISDGWIFFGTDSNYLFGLTNKESSSDSDDDGGSSSGSGGSGESGEDINNIVFEETSKKIMVVGTKVEFNFTGEDNPIQVISLDPKINAGYKNLKIEVLQGTSSYATPISGRVYKNINIWLGKAGFATPQNLDNVDVIFRVEKSWLEQYTISTDLISLHRYSDDKWNEMPTEEMPEMEDDEFVYFKARVPGFSPFVIAGTWDVDEAAEEEPVEVVSVSDLYSDEDEGSDDGDVAMEVTSSNSESDSSSDKQTPGFGALLALSVLSIFLFRKRA